MYTHHWYRPLDLDGGRYAEFVHDIRSLLLHLERSHIDHPFSNEIMPTHEQIESEVDNDHIFFRIGSFKWEDWRCWRTSYEQRHPEQNPSHWHICSTRSLSARSPYDLTACTLLIAFKHHFPEIAMVSEAEASLWSDIVDWYKRCFPDRTVLPGPWSPEVSRLRLDDVVLLDSDAQRMGYRVSREKGMLFLVANADRKNILGNNQIFVDDQQGRSELAAWIRYLSDTQAIVNPWEKQWSRWSATPGLPATWTTQIAELWLSEYREYIDVRKVQAQDGSGTHAWIPRRALTTLIKTPDDLKHYRLQLLEEDGQVRAVRVEERWNGYAEPRNPQRLSFFPIAILHAMKLVPSSD